MVKANLKWYDRRITALILPLRSGIDVDSNCNECVETMQHKIHEPAAVLRQQREQYSNSAVHRSLALFYLFREVVPIIYLQNNTKTDTLMQSRLFSGEYHDNSLVFNYVLILFL